MIIITIHIYVQKQRTLLALKCFLGSSFTTDLSPRRRLVRPPVDPEQTWECIDSLKEDMAAVNSHPTADIPMKRHQCFSVFWNNINISQNLEPN